jgi:uncharacterized membrane protein YeaQ/YmgE (transglycosylase-associated protein family)
MVSDRGAPEPTNDDASPGSGGYDPFETRGRELGAYRFLPEVAPGAKPGPECRRAGERRLNVKIPAHEKNGEREPMLILAMIVLGLAAGWVAQLVLGSGRQIDWQLALITGLIGSFVGGLLASLVAGDGLRIRPSGLIGSILGAIVVLAIVQGVRGGRTSTR